METSSIGLGQTRKFTFLRAVLHSSQFEEIPAGQIWNQVGIKKKKNTNAF